MNNYIVFNEDKYSSNEEMWEDIRTMIQICTRNDYECLIYYEDCGNYIFQVCDHDKSLGAPRFATIEADEEELLYDLRNTKSEELC